MRDKEADCDAHDPLTLCVLLPPLSFQAIGETPVRSNDKDESDELDGS
jgi:hypothetical protein